MHGKATLILTDKDTGRVVEQIEEHNMVTNALNNIFSVPPYIAYNSSSGYIFNGYLPMYNNVLKGLVLFSENIPENAYDFMLSGNHSVLATAGDEYSGSDAMRGSFNASSSGEIENGYRFVWDFAPEKAVGTIKSLCLTNRLLGNRGDLSLSGASSYFSINPSDLANGNYNNTVSLFHGSGTFFLQKGDDMLYSYVKGSPFIEILQYRIANPLGLKICDKTEATLVRDTKIDLSFNSNSSYAFPFYDVKGERLYVLYLDYVWVNNVRYYQFRYAKINPVTAELELETDLTTTNVPYESRNGAVFDGKLYLLSPNLTISVCSLSGELERTINPGIYTFYNFETIDGKLAIDCKLTSSGRRCLHFLDEAKTDIMQNSDIYVPIATDIVKYPYCLTTYNGYIYLQIRTDYLATINNLSTPLEKTDQHALQVRYEITN